jgi:cysteine desulfurase
VFLPLSKREFLCSRFNPRPAIVPAVIYFDHNATSPLCAAARDAWLTACERYPANPASPHRLGARAETALESARQTAADFLECSPLDIVWTSGATEANNALFHHIALDASADVWVSAIEHPSILEAARRSCPSRLKIIPVTPHGVVDLDWIVSNLKRSRPSLIAVMAANNETGVLQPWKEILALCRTHGVPYACDAAQWIGKLPTKGLGQCDFITACAHKFGGPLGIGFMKVPPNFKPFIVGGGQEDGRRAGTQNVAATLGMMAAWQLRERQLATGETKLRESWRDAFIAEVQRVLPEFQVLGANAPRLWNTVSALMPAMEDCRRRWVVRLDKSGFAVSTGSACASGKEKPSHVVTAMGLSSEGDRMLRFSSGWETTAEEWRSLARALVEISRIETAGR